MKQVSLIFTLFACIHSITVSSWFKRACSNALGETFMRAWYRFLYNAISIITVLLAIYFISQVPDRELWTAPLWLNLVMRGIQFAGLAIGALAFEHMDSREFMGFRQVWRYITLRETAGNIEGLTQKELVRTGVYGIVRHPMYLAGMVIFTFSPIITVNGLTVTVLADFYFLFGVFIEERRFLSSFGEEYREYMKHLPRLIPKMFYRRGRRGGPGT
jgi:protein-S-isoprenylcysteine O-methyltransferase Ste14